MKKRLITLALVAALAAVAVVGGSLAYFTDTTDTKNNVFTVGNVDITLEEPAWDATGSKDAAEVYPGEALAKDPTVENTGANPCFVCVKVTGLDTLGADNLIHYRTNYVVDALGEGWVDGGDGFFYYTKVLDLDGKTTPVFDSIVIPTTVTNGDATATYSVDVYAEAVQAQGAKPSWSAVQAMSLEEIQAWFTTCGMN